MGKAGAIEFFTYRDNTGGVNYRSNEININQSPEKTEMADLNNMEIYRNGGLAAQKGNAQLNTGVTDATAVLGIGEYKSSTGSFVVYTKASGKAYVMSIGGGAETQINTGLSTTGIPVFVNFNNVIVCFNGVDMPWYYNGASTSTVSTPPGAWTATKPTCGAVMGGKRIFAIAGPTLYYCALGNQNDWTAASDAGSITGFFSDWVGATTIAEYGTKNVIVYTGKPGIYLVTGTGPADYAMSPIATNRAAIGLKTVATINDFQYFFTGDGILPVMTTDLGVIKLGPQYEITYKIKPWLNQTETQLPRITIDGSKDSSAILLPHYLKNELVAYFKTQGNSNYDTAAIYNFDTNNFTFRTASTVTSAAVMTSHNVSSQIYTGTTDGRIIQEFVGTSLYDNAVFQKRVLTPFFDFGAPHVEKRILRMFMWFKSTINLGFEIDVYVDYGSRIIETIPIITTNVTGSAYGTAIYGTSAYSAAQITFENFPTQLTGNSFQFDIRSTQSNMDFRIIGYSFEVEFLDAY